MLASVTTERTAKGFSVLASAPDRIAPVRGTISRNRTQFGLYIDGVPHIERHPSFPAALSAFKRRAESILAMGR